jgi:dipeptidase E
VLFLPTASGDSERYWESFRHQYGKLLGCACDLAKLVGKRPGEAGDLAPKVAKADAIYVGGGNTMRLMQAWRKHGLDALLAAAWQRGAVMSGLSAGAICWFRFGCSSSAKQVNPARGLIRVRALGLVGATMCPHYDSEKDRRPELARIMRTTAGVGLALDDCCALEIVDGEWRLLTSREGAAGYRLYWLRGELREESLQLDGLFRPLAWLLRKG